MELSSTGSNPAFHKTTNYEYSLTKIPSPLVGMVEAGTASLGDVPPRFPQLG